MDITNVPIIGSLVAGLIFGIAAAWSWLRSRTTVEIELAKSEGAVELASARERANRIPALEGQLTKLHEAEQGLRAENSSHVEAAS